MIVGFFCIFAFILFSIAVSNEIDTYNKIPSDYYNNKRKKDYWEY